MDTIYIPNENDFRRWVKEALKEYFESDLQKSPPETTEENGERLLCRKEVAGMFHISLVTLHDWMKRGLPSHKQRGRVYFIKSEVMEYAKQNRRSRN